MKYGESVFDILYLLTAIVCGVILLVKAKSGAGKKMALATLILGVGDAFHLVPRVVRYFSAGDLTAALGIGKFVTSVTMTVFYVFLYYLWLDLFREKEDRRRTAAVWVLFALRVVLCLFPQNGWLRNDSGMLWGILRNVPFTALGAMIVVLFFRRRREAKRFRFVWLYAALSFLFYIPVAVGAGAAPMLGMLMLPKTICYVLLIVTFMLYVMKDREKNV